MNISQAIIPKLLIFTMVALLLIKMSAALAQDEICRMRQQKCIGFYNNEKFYMEKCSLLDCSGTHTYACNKYFCATSLKACHEFENKLVYINIGRSSLVKINKVNNYIKNIKNCMTIKHRLTSNDYCINNQSCSLIRINPIRNENAKTEILCPCHGEFNYHCGRNYCTVDSMACNSLKTNPMKIHFNIRRCDKKDLVKSPRISLHF